MAEDSGHLDKQDVWQPGDLALCVRGGEIPSPLGVVASPREYPKAGRIYTVESVGTYYSPVQGNDIFGLWLKDGPINGQKLKTRVWAAYRFRKINPLSEEEERNERDGLRQDLLRLRVRGQKASV